MPNLNQRPSSREPQRDASYVPITFYLFVFLRDDFFFSRIIVNVRGIIWFPIGPESWSQLDRELLDDGDSADDFYCLFH